MRLSKNVNGTQYTYLYHGGNLMQETVGTKILDYFYDASGKPLAVKYRTSENSSPEWYYYALNSRGDVIGLYTPSGNLYCTYTYDVWGNILSVKNANGVEVTYLGSIVHLQSLKYRGYVYDLETGLYYLQSRYYDPVTHRFINADGLVSTGTGVLGYNMFAYCDNNPVVYTDSNGESLLLSCILLGVMIGATIGACIGAEVSKKTTGKVTPEAIGIGVAIGGTIGGLAGYGLGLFASAAVGVTTAASAAEVALNNESSVSSFINNAGESASKVLPSFQGTPQLKTLEVDTLAYRFWGGEAAEFGHWVSPFNYGPEARNLLSLPPNNTMEYLSEFILQKGTTVLSGEAAPYFGMSGGGVQWWVPKL